VRVKGIIVMLKSCTQTRTRGGYLILSTGTGTLNGFTSIQGYNTKNVQKTTIFVTIYTFTDVILIGTPQSKCIKHRIRLDAHFPLFFIIFELLVHEKIIKYD
jgi:hypothetical protein